MTYSEIKKKLEDLTMEPSDWQWLSDYLKNNGHYERYYGKFVNEYQAREEKNKPVCNSFFGLCRYCGYGFKCGYKGFCSMQRTAMQ